MAIKFIVLVVFAAVAQAFLALTSKDSSAIKTAKEATLAAWSGVFQTVCKATQDKSVSLEDAREEFRSYQISGGSAFLNLAPRSNNTSLRIETAAFSAAFRDAIFRAIREARKCSNYTVTMKAIETYKTQLPYDKFIEDFHATTDDTGSYARALDLFKDIYGKLFSQIGKLATTVCGGGEAIGTCDTKDIQPKIDEYVKIAYSWLSKHD